MTTKIKIKKGLDIPLEGVASDEMTVDTLTERYAVTPDDYNGYTWKTAVKAGDSVKAGQPLLYAKEDEDLSLTSPVSGTVLEVHRGERRKIEFISVQSDGKEDQVEYAKPKTKEEQLAALKKSGLFAMMRQRPFDMVPMVSAEPRDIFVTAFDTAPLAKPLLTDTVLTWLEKGLEVLSGFTRGKVYLSVPAGSGITSAAAEVFEFSGPHPSGNVGTQIAAIRPVNKGETIWTLDAVTAARIGRFISEGKIDYTADVALTGPDIINPRIVKTKIGASLATLLKGEVNDTDKHVRVISGNVLTGKKVDAAEGWLRWPYRQITVIDEGDTADEFMGWASVNPNKYSVKRSFPAFLKGLNKPFHFDARLKGGHRAFIMSNEYDKVFPMDIYPEYLLKAIMAGDIERMEQLGIYEVAPEDFALPEFVDTSKQELQKIVRDGLDYLLKETI